MRRSGNMKFPHSVQLFKFCHKVLIDRRGQKVHDQEVGNILEFNPSDCSHWKRGEKNVKSVFSLAKLADALQVEPTLLHDLSAGLIDLEEAYFEFKEAQAFKEIEEIINHNNRAQQAMERVKDFVASLHKQADFLTPPLYLPEVLRFFPFITIQPVEMMDKLSRILRVKQGSYTIQYRKGELRPQTRMSMARDLSRILFEAERERFPQLGAVDAELLYFEEILFTSYLLLPRTMLLNELRVLDSRRNMVAELASAFWVPKALVSFQLKNIIRVQEAEKLENNAKRTYSRDTVDDRLNI